MSGHIPHHQGDPGPGQRDHIEPVPAQVGVRAGGLVAAGDLHRVEHRQALREQAALQGQGGVVFARVAAGVVHGESGPGGQFGGQGDVVVVEGLGIPPPVERGHAHQDVPRGQGYGDERVDPGGTDDRSPLGILVQPWRREVQVSDEFRLEIGHAQGLGRGRTESAQFAHGQRLRWPHRLENGLVGRPTQCEALVGRAGRGRVAPEHRVQQIHRHAVRQSVERHLGQFLCGAPHIQGGADTYARLVDQLHPLPGPVGIGDVDDRVAQSEHRSLGVLEPEDPGGPDVLTAGIGRSEAALDEVEHRFAGGQDAFHHRLDLGDVQVGQRLADPLAQPLPDRHTGHPLQCQIAPGAAQIGVGDQQADRRLVEQAGQYREVFLPPPRLGLLGGQQQPEPRLVRAHPGVCPQDHGQVSPVLAAQSGTDLPPLCRLVAQVGGRREDCCAPGSGEQGHSRPPQNLGGFVAQQLLCTRTPPDEHPAGVRHRCGRPSRSERAAGRTADLGVVCVRCHAPRPCRVVLRDLSKKSCRANSLPIIVRRVRRGLPWSPARPAPIRWRR